jgi:hypothetical protein
MQFIHIVFGHTTMSNSKNGASLFRTLSHQMPFLLYGYRPGKSDFTMRAGTPITSE